MRRGEPALRRPRSGETATLATIALMVAWACARDTGTPPAADSSSLESSARQYLELKQRHAWAQIYDEIVDPESRKTLERQRFLKRRENAFDILSFEVVSAEKEGNEGRVRATMEAMIPVRNPGGETSLIRKKVQDPQKWVNRDGRWYIQLDG